MQESPHGLPFLQTLQHVRRSARGAGRDAAMTVGAAAGAGAEGARSQLPSVSASATSHGVRMR
jgi:hypothetical protein